MLRSVWKKYWFLIGLVLISFITVADPTDLLVRPGLWLKGHHGPDLVIVLIFFFSGLSLDTARIRAGLSDYRGTAVSLLLIFVAAPLLALLISIAPLPTGLLLGLFLVASMPTTLSSGVVMSGAAGGNIAHALLITVIANGLATFTIPPTLGALLSSAGETRAIVIDQLPMMIKIGTLVILPLVIGWFTRRVAQTALKPVLPITSMINQLCILSMVWMALCAGRPAIIGGLGQLLPVIAIVILFHLILLCAGFVLAGLAGIPKGRRESVILMGGQKTLPLSVILQVSLFSDYGIALVVCVVHHIVHLMIDAVVVQYLKNRK